MLEHAAQPATPPATDAADSADDAAEAAVTEPGTQPAAGPRPARGGGRVPRARRGLRRARPILSRVATALAALIVFVALVAPAELSQIAPAALVRLPVEGLVAVVLLLVLPPRARGVTAVLAGLVLGLAFLVKVLDIGFGTVLGRRFDPLMDWTLIRPAYEFVRDTAGRGSAIGAGIAAVLLIAALLAVMATSVVRLTGIVAGHRGGAVRGVAALGVVWVTCAVLGVHLAPDVPVASASTAGLAYDHGQLMRESWDRQQEFTTASAVDTFRNTPGWELLTGLRGKDVVVAFVESYGRDAVEKPEFAPYVDKLLDDGTQRLRAAGFDSRSAFLTSPTTGNGSWLSHATMLSGLWVDHEQRYRELMGTERTTLGHAFHRAGWRTVGLMPATTRDWPEAEFYGYDKLYTSKDLGYRGPNFAWAPMPDQYALSAFQRLERATAGPEPVMAEAVLVSSHAPWTPLPELVDWDVIGDGSLYAPMARAGEKPASLWRDGEKVRTQYRRSIEYTLGSLISYVEKYGDDDLVLMFVGDHQPPVVSSGSASRDVPVTIVAKDPAVLGQISGWGWQDGLNPGPQAPVWRMDAFRDRFLTTFSR